MGNTTILGLALGFGALLVAFVIEGGSISGLVNASALLIVFGGTFGATMISFPASQVLKLPALVAKTISGGQNDAPATIAQFTRFAVKARREGLLALEEDATRLSEGFQKKGLLLIIDGTDPDVVRSILETEIEAVGKRHEDSYGMLEAMGGYSPTMGIIGTVMGLVNVLGNLSSPEELGPAIAVAFLATFYGVAAANLLWLPLARKLKENSKAEVYLYDIMLEGILSVQAGDNFRIVQEKLNAFLPLAMRGQGVGGNKGTPPPSETEAPVELASGARTAAR